MGRRKLSENNIRKITKLGKGSLAITIPMELVKKLRLRNKQKVVVTEKRGKLSIKDWKK